MDPPVTIETPLAEEPEHGRRLLALFDGLARAERESDVAATLAEGFLQIAGAGLAVIGVRSEGSLSVAAVLPHDAGPDAEFLLDGPLRDAVASGEDVVIGDRQAWKQRYPGIEHPRGAAWIAVPLRGVRRPLGAAGLAFEEPPDPEAIRRVRFGARHGGLVLDRAIQADRERQIASELQRGLAPDPLPDIAGFAVHAAYAAGGEGRLGGDWYDVFPLPDGRVALVVGDVAGSGVENVADMARVRHTVHAFLHDHGDPSRALSQTRDVFEAVEDDLFATVLAVVVEPHTGNALCSRAGHVPPLLIERDGARFVVEGASPPLGAPRTHEPRNAPARMEPGSSLLLFTDGIIEDRHRDISKGLELLRSRAVAAPDDPRVLTEAAMSLPAEHGDDRTVVALRRDDGGLGLGDRG